jgi:anaerobic magnesium-protoporphyrin IX monomethyl ester cyclase
VKTQLGDKRHWHESGDLDMMFFGTYRTEFYRSVRDLLHDQVSAARSPTLQQRWNELARREAQFRTRHEKALDAPLAVGGLP